MACRTQKCWDQIMHCCKTAPPHTAAAKQPHHTTAAAKQRPTPLYRCCKTDPQNSFTVRHPTTKPKKLASYSLQKHCCKTTGTPCKKSPLLHVYSKAIYNNGEAGLKDLSAPCIPIKDQGIRTGP